MNVLLAAILGYIRNMRIRLLATSFVLLAAACGGGQDASGADPTTVPQPTEAGVATSPSSTTPGAAPVSSEAPTLSVAPTFDGPPAPDFTTILSDGTEFSLAAHDRPVYLVFWAEW